MTTSNPQLTKLAAWEALEAHYPKVRELHPGKALAASIILLVGFEVSRNLGGKY